MKKCVFPFVIIGLSLLGCQDNAMEDSKKSCPLLAYGEQKSNMVNIRLADGFYDTQDVSLNILNETYSFVYDSAVTVYNWVNIPDKFEQASLVIQGDVFEINMSDRLSIKPGNSYQLTLETSQVTLLENENCVDLILY